MVCFDETYNTLKFAARAKSVRVHAKRNELDENSQTHILLRAYRLEIEQLKEKLRSMELQQKGEKGGAERAKAEKVQEGEIETTRGFRW